VNVAYLRERWVNIYDIIILFELTRSTATELERIQYRSPFLMHINAMKSN